MRIHKSFLAVTAAICFFSFQSCKKGDPAPNPLPVATIRPDTLSAGWSKLVVSTETNDFNDVFFNSATTGYLATSSKIYKSTDGGNNWLQVSTASTTIFNIFMTGDSKAFFAGQSNTILKTIDGGSTFVSTSVPTATAIIDIFFIDNTTGYGIAQDGLYTTIDGGVIWTKITSVNFPLLSSDYASLYCINNTTGWIVTPNGIYKSSGSLANWQQATLTGGSGAIKFKSVYATSASNIYTANEAGEIYKSTDGGVSFAFIKKLDEPGFTDLHFITNQIGYANSGRTIYKTTDGGVNWLKVVSLGQGKITEIHFTDATHGWACGNNGVNGIVLTFR